MLQEIWYTFVDFVRTFGALQLFFVRLLVNSPSIIVRRGGLVIKQIHNAGALSLVIIMVCGLFVGGVLGLQGYSNLSKFNAEDSVGTFAAFSLLKELGPVITALLFAGRAGTALASEIGLMKATDQLSAMEMMAINPLRRVLVPRFLGGVISMPLLAAVFSVIGLFGAHIVGRQFAGCGSGRILAADAVNPGNQRHKRRHHQERCLRHRGQLAGGLGGL